MFEEGVPQPHEASGLPLRCRQGPVGELRASRARRQGLWTAVEERPGGTLNQLARFAVLGAHVGAQQQSLVVPQRRLKDEGPSSPNELAKERGSGGFWRRPSTEFMDTGRYAQPGHARLWWHTERRP